MIATLPRLAFLFDVDNTLLDNDRVRLELGSAIDHLVGAQRGRRFWELYEAVRHDCDHVDFPRTLERFARATGQPGTRADLATRPFRTRTRARLRRPGWWAASQTHPRCGPMLVIYGCAF